MAKTVYRSIRDEKERAAAKRYAKFGILCAHADFFFFLGMIVFFAWCFASDEFQAKMPAMVIKYCEFFNKHLALVFVIYVILWIVAMIFTCTTVSGYEFRKAGDDVNLMVLFFLRFVFSGVYIGLIFVAYIICGLVSVYKTLPDILDAPGFLSAIVWLPIFIGLLITQPIIMKKHRALIKAVNHGESISLGTESNSRADFIKNLSDKDIYRISDEGYYLYPGRIMPDKILRIDPPYGIYNVDYRSDDGVTYRNENDHEDKLDIHKISPTLSNVKAGQYVTNEGKFTGA